MPLHIFREKILSTNFKEITKMIDAFIRKESNFIECFTDILLLAPINAPVIIFSLSPAPTQQSLLDAVGEVGLELDF